MRMVVMEASVAQAKAYMLRRGFFVFSVSGESMSGAVVADSSACAMALASWLAGEPSREVYCRRVL